MIKTTTQRNFRLLLAAFSAVLLAVAASATPANVIIRVPAGTASPVALPGLLARWRQSGQVSNVLLLTQGRAEKTLADRTAKFETFVVLEFLSEASCEAWQKNGAPALPAGLIVRRADALAHGELTPRDSNRSVFIVNTYTPLVPPARFNDFVQGYVKPLYEAMRGTKHLVRYTAYLERGETGKVDALNVLEYRDHDAFKAVVAMKTSIRDQVAAATPSYREFDQIKDTLRLDGYGTAASYTELPSPDLSHLPSCQPQGKISLAFGHGSEPRNSPYMRTAEFRGLLSEKL